MQKHKKYLVVTVWISTIAFVGAGFVGWGAYSLGSAGGVVQQVGDVKITQRELQQEYSRLYRFYNDLSGGKMDQEQAQKMGIDKQALQNLSTQAMLMNHAMSLGLRVEPKEVASKIAHMEAFQSEGTFSKELYERLLTQNNFKIPEFESAISKEILLEKLDAIYAPALSELEKESVASAFYLADTLELLVLKAESFAPQVGDDEVKSFWEGSKERYQTPRRYDINAVMVKSEEVVLDDSMISSHYEAHKSEYLDAEGKILPLQEARSKVEMELREQEAKNGALKHYVALKRGESPQAKELALLENNTSMGAALLESLASAKEGETLKPVAISGGFITYTLKAVTPRQAKSFEEAAAEAREALVKQKRAELLKSEAESKLSKGFSGQKVEGVTREDIGKLSMLDPQDSARFLRELFESKNPQGVVMLDGKAVVYKIWEQKLLDAEKLAQNQAFIQSNLNRLKEDLVQRALLKSLQETYPISN